MSIEFLLLSLIVVIAPGTGVIYTLANGLTGGWRRGVVAAFGCTMGILPHIAAAVFGLSAMLHASAVGFQAIKIAGVAYLLYLAWSALQESGALSIENGNAPQSWRNIVIKGFLINILNPKLSIFFLAFLPQFVISEAGSATIQMLWMGGVFMAMTLVVFIGYGLFAALVRTQVVSRPVVMTWFRRIIAGAFFSLGVKLALAER